jgi:enoyl-CoA hydratase/carnithine racemase
MASFLIFEQHGHIVTLTMNEPERRNPLTGNSAVEEFLAAIARIDGDKNVHAVILTGRGPSFSAGGDIRNMLRQTEPQTTLAELRGEYQRGIQKLALALFDLEVPVIAAINGHAIGAGLDLACMCDIRIAADNAQFAESFVKIGLVSGDGGTWLLPRVIGLARASELALTGETIDAAQALAWNLVSRVVPAEQLLPTAKELASKIAANPNGAVRMTKRLIRMSLNTDLANVLKAAAAFQAMAHKTPEHRAAIEIFLKK